MNHRASVLAALLSSAPALLQAQPVAPIAVAQEGTTAESDQALRELRAAAAAEPARADAWVQIADIEARRGNVSGCVDALHQAVAASPGDAGLYSRLSQTYAGAGHGKAALHAIDAALALRPGHVA